MYIRVKFKRAFFHRNILLIFFFGLLVSGVSAFLKARSISPENVTLFIADSDKSDASKRLIRELKSKEKLVPKQKADLVLEIKEGFEKHFLEGDLKNLLRFQKGEKHSSSGLFQDRIAGEVINQYIYFDIFKRMGKENNIDFPAYEAYLEKTKTENEIFFLLVKPLRKEAKEIISPKGYDFYSKYFHFVMITLVGIFINAASFIRLALDRERAMLQRLCLSGLGKLHFLFTEFLISHLRVLVFLTGFLIFSTDIETTTLFLSLVMIELSFLIFLFLEETLKKAEVLRLFAPLLAFFLIGGGIFIQYFKL